MYPLLAAIFFLSLAIGTLLLIGIIFKPKAWRNNVRSIRFFCSIWFTLYFIFILFFTGPVDLSQYPNHRSSPYKLPWKAGVSRILSQGNRSFTSHQGLHLYAWDFVMPNGTEVLAVRDGIVIEIEQKYSTIGLSGNYVYIRHADGQISGYFHLQKNSVQVKIDDTVKQGQTIALSGMTGQTTLPHLHFAVFNSDRTASIPISFQDVENGVPLAGHIYTSANIER